MYESLLKAYLITTKIISLQGIIFPLRLQRIRVAKGSRFAFRASNPEPKGVDMGFNITDQDKILAITMVLFIHIYTYLIVVVYRNGLVSFYASNS